MSTYEYVHGDVSCKNAKINFAVNINPLGPPEILKALSKKMLKILESYPTVKGEGVVKFYSEKFGIPKKSIAAGNGASELIYLLPRILNIQKVLILVPIFHDYLRAFSNAGIQIVPFALRKEYAFTVDWRKLKTALRETDGLILCNPNNPTGSAIKAKDILNLSREFEDKMFVIDESFVQFSDIKLYGLIEQKLPDNIVVIHSLTKFYALAGLRIGAMIATEKLIEKVFLYRPPWSLNSIADEAAPLLLKCEEYENRTKRIINSQKFVIKSVFSSLKNYRLYDSNSNFFLAEYRGEMFDLFLENLKKRGICVRDCRNFEYLEGNFFRFAIKTEAENRVLLNALQD